MTRAITEAKASLKESEGRIFKGPDMDSIEEILSKWKSLGHYFFHCLGEKFPDRILFTDYESGRRWTGAQLKDKVLSVACALVDRYDFQAGTVVCISHNNSDHVLILALAIICAGGVVACAYPKDPYGEVLNMARKVGPKFLFCHSRNIGWVERMRQDLGYRIEGVSMDGTHEDRGRAQEKIGLFSDFIDYDHESSPAREKIPVACKDPRKELVIILMSSGTTGNPKGVPHTHSNILADVFADRLKAEANCTFACPAALDYASARILMFGGIHVGYHTVILNGFKPSTYLDAVQKHSVQVLLTGTASLYEIITHPRLGEYDISSVKCVFPMGAKLTYLDELRNFLKHHPHVTTLSQGYGASEVGFAFTHSVTPQEYLADSSNCGRVSRGLQAKIVDPVSGRLLGPNQQGIVHLKGDTVFPGYYDLNSVRAREGENGRALTDGDFSPFIRNAEIFDNEGYYITGDYAYFNEREDLYLIGRQKEVMFCRGAKKVAPQELESVVNQHLAVDKVCVLGVDNKRELTVHCPRAFVVPKARYYDENVDDSRLELGERLATLDNGSNEAPHKEELSYRGASEPKTCRLRRERRHLIAEDLMRFVNERVGWEKQLTGGIVLLDDIPLSKGTGKMDKKYLRSLSSDDIEIYGDRSS